MTGSSWIAEGKQLSRAMGCRLFFSRFTFETLPNGACPWDPVRGPACGAGGVQAALPGEPEVAGGLLPAAVLECDEFLWQWEWTAPGSP